MMNYFKNRKLQVDIVTIFLFLIGLSSFVIIVFSYEKNSKAVLEFSKGTIHRVSALIIERIECIFGSLERAVELSSGIFSRHPKISEDNSILISHFLDEVKYHRRDLYGFYVGTPDGSFLVVLNMAIVGRENLSKSAPLESAYALFLIDTAQSNSTQIWQFYDKDLKLLYSESIAGIEYDPRKRPWYIEGEKGKGPYWTDVYTFIFTNKQGITIAQPVYDSDQLIGVLGADFSLDEFTAFFASQKIGKHGHAFILDSSNRVIIPESEPDPTSQKVISSVLNDAKNDSVVEIEKKRYLVSKESFSFTLGKDWKIIIIAPFLDFFSQLQQTEHQSVLISLGILIIAALLVVYFAKRISEPIVILSKEVFKIKNLDLDSEVRVKSNIREIKLLDESISTMRSALRSFSRYVPKEIVRGLIQKGKEITLGGERREITLFFSDITGLTSIAETLPLETLDSLLAEYFDGLSKIIIKQHGTIDKYIGDSIMAFWDAPEDMPDHAFAACKAALECQEFLLGFNQKQKDKGLPELKTRIGINTGDVIAGNIGTNERMNYTVIGDVVNAAERLQWINKVYHTKIILGEETVRKIGNRFLTRPLDDLELKGRVEKTKVFELIAGREEATPKEVELAERFTKAYDAFHDGKLKEAKVLFEEIQRLFPSDFPTQFYLDRLKGM